MDEAVGVCDMARVQSSMTTCVQLRTLVAKANLGVNAILIRVRGLLRQGVLPQRRGAMNDHRGLYSRNRRCRPEEMAT
jgi:hypothetical protein